MNLKIRKRLTKAYLKAAQKIHDGELLYCCEAIACVLEHTEPSSTCLACAYRLGELPSFNDWFKPPNERAYWWGEKATPESQQARMLSLCFMAAMAEAGDLDASP